MAKPQTGYDRTGRLIGYIGTLQGKYPVDLVFVRGAMDDYYLAPVRVDRKIRVIKLRVEFLLP